MCLGSLCLLVSGWAVQAVSKGIPCCVTYCTGSKYLTLQNYGKVSTILKHTPSRPNKSVEGEDKILRAGMLIMLEYEVHSPTEK